jgi:hypothetical protein
VASIPLDFHFDSLVDVTLMFEIISCEPLQNSSFPYRPSQNRLSPVCHRVAISSLSMSSTLVFS